MTTTTTMRTFRHTDRPVQPGEITAEMLAPIRQAADQSHLAQCVWPSTWYGPDFQGLGCLLTCMPMPLPWESPTDAEPGSRPFLTVLPARYHDRG